jgi:hypothetical protein
MCEFRWTGVTLTPVIAEPRQCVELYLKTSFNFRKDTVTNTK